MFGGRSHLSFAGLEALDNWKSVNVEAQQWEKMRGGGEVPRDTYLELAGDDGDKSAVGGAHLDIKRVWLKLQVSPQGLCAHAQQRGAKDRTQRAWEGMEHRHLK